MKLNRFTGWALRPEHTTHNSLVLCCITWEIVSIISLLRRRSSLLLSGSDRLGACAAAPASNWRPPKLFWPPGFSFELFSFSNSVFLEL